MLGVGSILGLANVHSHVWGSGYLNPTVIHAGVHQAKFHALRGQKTLDLLRSFGIHLPDLPLGDPGILVDGLPHLKRPKESTRFRAAVIPHHDYTHHDFYSSLRANDEVCVVNILDASLRPIEQIASSQVVVSQSLHGLIFAESLGKPSVWISVRNDAIWKFKFEDWYSTTHEPQLDPLPLSDFEGLVKSARLNGSRIDRAALVSSFPLEFTIGSSAPFVDFVSCRAETPLVIRVNSIMAGRAYSENEIDESILESRGKELMAQVYGLFQNHSERGYCALVPVDENLELSDAVLSEACRFLDSHSNFDYAYLIPAARGCLGGAHPEESALLLRPGPKVAAGAVMLRPDSNELNRNFVSLY
ncbi:MAG: polysaccharide pyruvyl transferase family protein, partial [Rhodospirillales bacterium]|nr:polysaccharide pyruvyl transferase family protein [Rhodospirillales bacterium]